MTINVMSADGKPWSIRKENLSEALKRGATLANAGEKVKVMSADGQPWEIKTANLGQALERGATLADASWSDRAKEFGRGLTSGIANTAIERAQGVVGKYAVAPVANAVSYVADKAGFDGLSQGADAVANNASNLTETLQTQREQAFATNNIPDTTSRVLTASGEAVGELPAWVAASAVTGGGAAFAKGVQLTTKAGKLINAPWLQKLNKFLHVPVGTTKQTAGTVASFAGMGAGAELAKSDAPEANAGENAIRGVLGGILGGSIAPLATSTAKGVYNVFRHPIEFAQNVETSAAAALNRGNLNKEAIDAAKKIGLQLPPSLATDSAVANFIEDTALKSFYTSKAYNKVIEDIPVKIIQEIEKNLDQVGTKIAASGDKTALQTASNSYGEALVEQKDIWKEQSQELFNNAKNQLTNADVITPTKTLNDVEEIISELSKTVGQSSAEKTNIVNYLDDFAAELRKGFASKIDRINTGVPVSNLMGKQQELLNLSKYGEDAGYKNFYNRVAGVLTDELAGYKGNKAFAENYLPARTFYRENIISKIKSSTARRLLKEELPKEALDFMNTSKSVNELERILGNHENSKSIMGTLKRAKLAEVLQDKNIVTTDGQFNSQAFLNTFNKDSQESLLKALMGENFKTVQNNIAPIARAMEASGKKSTRTLSTASGGKDLALGIAAGAGVLSGHTSTAAGAVGGMALINSLSRAFANPQYLEKLIARQTPKKGAVNLANAYNKLDTPATNASILKYGVSEALPTAASTISDGLMGGEFTGEVKRMYDDGKKKKESLKR